MNGTYEGSCHCRRVRFRADVDLAGTFRCNCSICFKSRAWLAAVPASDFRLLAGKDALRDYQFGPMRIHHFFCSHCGVRPFSRGQDDQGRDSYAVRVSCLDGVPEQALVDAPVRYFDMRHDRIDPPAETRHL